MDITERMRAFALKQDWKSYYAEKSAEFDQRRTSGVWPSKSCERCAKLAPGQCCQFLTHGPKDCCLHCGDDQRAPR